MYVSLLFFHACLKGFRNSFSILLWWQLKLLFLSLFTTDIKLHLKGLNMASFSSPPLLDTFHVLLCVVVPYHTPHKMENWTLPFKKEVFLRSSGISGKYLAWKNFLLGNSRANFPFFSTSWRDTFLTDLLKLRGIRLTHMTRRHSAVYKMVNKCFSQFLFRWK